MYVSPEVAEIIQKTVKMAQDARFEYVTPELTLYVICGNPVFAKAFRNCDGNVRKLDCQLKTWLEENMEQTEEEAEETSGEEASAHTPTFSYSMELMMSYALESAQNSEKSVVELSHLIHALYALPESYAVYFMQSQGVEHAALLQELTILYEEISSIRRHKSEKKKAESGENIPGTDTPKTEENLLEEPEDWELDNLPDEEDEDTEDSFRQQYAACLNHSLEGTNPLIGRQEELERTMQSLCRKEKTIPSTWENRGWAKPPSLSAWPDFWRKTGFRNPSPAPKSSPWTWAASLRAPSTGATLRDDSRRSWTVSAGRKNPSSTLTKSTIS